MQRPGEKDAGQECQREPEQRQESGQSFERSRAGLVGGLHGYLPRGSIVQAVGGMGKRDKIEAWGVVGRLCLPTTPQLLITSRP